MKYLELFSYSMGKKTGEAVVVTIYCTFYRKCIIEPEIDRPFRFLRLQIPFFQQV